MAKINKVYPAFFNGVSQQSPELVLDNQCKEMVNCIPDIVQGITKRPPLRYVTSRGFDQYPEMENASVFHTYDRGEDDEEYIMVNVDDESAPVQIFNKAGEQMRVNIPYNKRTEILDYLTSGSLKGLTVQDRTWVFSKNAIVSLDTEGTYPLQPDYTRVAFYWLKRGSGDRYNPFNYAVYLNNTIYAVDPDKPASAGDTVEGDPETGAEDSDVAAQQLAEKINAATAQAYGGELSLSQSLAYKEFPIYLGPNKTGVTAPDFGDNASLIEVSDWHYSPVTGMYIFAARVADFDPFGSTVVSEFTISEDNVTGFTAEVRGSMLKIYKDDGSDFNFSSWDSWGNQASEGWKGEVNKISDLPKDMPFHDVYVKILGDESNTFTDYFVHWNGSSWEECLDPEADRGVLSSMPIKMDRNYLGTNALTNLGWLGGGDTRIVWLQKGNDNVFLDVMFEQGLIQNYIFNLGYSLYVYVTGSGAQFQDSTYFLTQDLSTTYIRVADEASTDESSYTSFYNALGLTTYSTPTAWFDVDTIDWSTPRVGNIDNNPDPSFVGRKIQDLFFYKNRLGIASEDSVSLTETANYTNFYATTVVDIVDTDVIDITISTNQASKIYYAKPFNNSLYIFTKYAQYELVSEGIFSPSTVSLNNTTNYPMAIDVEPVVINDRLLFISTTNNRQQLREYIKTDNLNVTGVDLNVSTPTYMAKPIKKIIADGVLGYVLCCTDTGTIYFYSFKEDGTQRIQSAWSRWELIEYQQEYYSDFEYNVLGSDVIVTFKGSGDYKYQTLPLVPSDTISYRDEIGFISVGPPQATVKQLIQYKSSILLPDYYPQIGTVRTPLNKMLIKRVKVEGEGAFNGDVYRKDYNKTYTKSKDYSMKDLDLNVASKVGNVDITIYDDSTDNFKLTSVVVEGLFNTTSREMR